MNIQAFRDEYCRDVSQLPGVTGVEFIGSVVNGNFNPGSSDLDIFVHGNRIPRASKRKARELVRELSSKYGLGLDTAPYQHPTPFFIDRCIIRMLYHLLKGRHGASWLRAAVKKVAPSYGLIWRLQKKGLNNMANQLEGVLASLSPEALDELASLVSVKLAAKNGGCLLPKRLFKD